MHHVGVLITYACTDCAGEVDGGWIIEIVVSRIERYVDRYVQIHHVHCTRNSTIINKRNQARRFPNHHTRQMAGSLLNPRHEYNSGNHSHLTPLPSLATTHEYTYQPHCHKLQFLCNVFTLDNMGLSSLKCPGGLPQTGCP